MSGERLLVVSARTNALTTADVPIPDLLQVVLLQSISFAALERPLKVAGTA